MKRANYKKIMFNIGIALAVVFFNSGIAFCSNIENMKASVVRVIVTGSVSNRAVCGSAFAVGKGDTYITNWHVVERVKWGWEINIVNNAGKLITCSLIDKDPKRDIAIIKSDAQYKKKPVTFCDVSEIIVGDDVYAMGFPGVADIEDKTPKGNQGITVTKGIISKVTKHKGMTYVQTDAAVNPGNSGGPLFNSSGKVVAINTLKPRQDRGSDMNVEGVGWGVRVDELCPLLKKNGIEIGNYKYDDVEAEEEETQTEDENKDEEPKAVKPKADKKEQNEESSVSNYVIALIFIVIAGCIAYIAKSFLSRPRQSFCLTALRGSLSGTTVASDEMFTVGRSAKCLLQFPPMCREVSREHFNIVYNKKAKAYYITDTSTNGTYLNGEKLTRFKPCRINNNDNISLGSEDRQLLRFNIL